MRARWRRKRVPRPCPVCAPGRAVGRGREVHVAAPAPSAAGHRHLLARRPQVADELAVVRIVHERAGGHAEHEIGAALALLLLAAAVLAAPCTQRLGVGEVEQGREPRVDGQDDGAAVAAVPPARAAARHVLLPPEAHAAVAPVARLDPDQHLVDEFHRWWGGMLADGPPALHTHQAPEAKRRTTVAKARRATPVRRPWVRALRLERSRAVVLDGGLLKLTPRVGWSTPGGSSKEDG